MALSFKEKCLGNGCWITYIIPLKVSRWQKHWLLLKAIWFFWMINKNDILEIGFFLKKTREKNDENSRNFCLKILKEKRILVTSLKEQTFETVNLKKREKGGGGHILRMTLWPETGKGNIQTDPCRDENKLENFWFLFLLDVTNIIRMKNII